MKGRIVPSDEGHPLNVLWHTRAIGASAAAAVLGKDRFQTPQDLFNYITKRAEKPPQTPQMLEGLAMEPAMLAAYEEIAGEPGEPVNLIDAEADFIRSQIDWMNYEQTRACEFKFSRSEKVAAYILDRNELPPFWRPQAQHKLMVLGLRQIDFFVMAKESGAHAHVHDRDTGDVFVNHRLVVERDEAYIQKLRSAEYQFWKEYIEPDICPPERKLKLRMEA